MSSSCNVLLAAESLTPHGGGVAQVARLIARVMEEEAAAGGLRGRAVVLNDRHNPEACRLPVAVVRGSRWRFVCQVQRAAVRHTHFIYDFLGMARAHCRVPGLRRPALSYIHGIEVWEGTPDNRIRTARKIDHLIANTHYTRERAERIHGGFARARVCWLATSTDEAPPAFPVPDRPTVLIVGRMDELSYKGHRELIACWPRVVSRIPDARLLIVGGGPRLETFRKLAADSPAAANIEFTGLLPWSEMPRVWSQASVFAMPSRGEGFGLVYIEAMRYGVPVLASVHDAAPEINLDGQTGYNVNLDRPDELCERVIHLLEDPSLAAELGRNGRQRWAEYFCYRAFRERFVPLLRDFLKD
jgi:phosphatidylinositol alpha-1,6-mannosyltransferase